MQIEFFSSAWHVFSSFLVFSAGMLFAPWVGSKFRLPRKRAWILYLWHTLFCVAYAFWVMENGGDALAYYSAALSGDINFDFGTAAINVLAYVLVFFGGFSFIGLFLVFNIFGFIGIIAFDASLRAATFYNSKRVQNLATLVVFLPSVSFWSSAVGKDSLAFMATGLALWAALQLQSRIWVMALSILTMVVVRPHMAGLLILALSAALAINSKGSIKSRLFLIGSAVAAAVVMVPLALNYSGLGEASNIIDLQEYVEQRQGYNMEGGGGVDIASMSLPMKLATYLFRPVIFEATSITSLAASIENALLLLMVVLAIRGYFRKRAPQLIGQRLFMWFYVSMAWLILASTTANLGIAVRQKWMFVPFFIYLIIPFIGKRTK